MTDLMLSDIAIAPPEVVRHATRDLAAALAETPAFTAYRAGCRCLSAGRGRPTRRSRRTNSNNSRCR